MKDLPAVEDESYICSGGLIDNLTHVGGELGLPKVPLKSDQNDRVVEASSNIDHFFVMKGGYLLG